MNPSEIYNTYPLTITLKWGEKLVHFSDLKLVIKDLINNWYTLWCYDWIFYSEWEYTSSSVNLVRTFPN